MATTQEVAQREAAGERPPILGALSEASRKADLDAAAEARAKALARPKPMSLQNELSAEARQELATEKFLLDGFYKAKLQNQDQDVELTDIQMIRDLQAIARHLCDRSRNRSR